MTKTPQAHLTSASDIEPLAPPWPHYPHCPKCHARLVREQEWRGAPLLPVYNGVTCGRCGARLNEGERGMST